MANVKGFLTTFFALCAGPLAHADAGGHADSAQPSPATMDRADHALQVTPYLWAAGLDGRLSPFRRGSTIGVEKSFSDVVDGLEFGGFANLWLRRDRFVFSGDVMYVATSDDHAFGPLPPLPVPVPPSTVVDGRVDSRQFNATAQAGYRLVEAQDFTLDALAGLRAWRISNDVTVSALGTSRSYGERFDWVDPVIGLRAFRRLSEAWSLQAQLDAGGLGVGADSTWSALATINYVATEHLSVAAGYKVLDVDYDHGGHVYDARLKGRRSG
ncbi:hypothetical protein [Marilutibacter alkalisoli]|uniref:hypothetical protein n=1 Tax=Marilutibacter alkalisoli TaxID=2591633 RepID=UPI001ABDED97|nr:hypothetical protein [Lysobacter alkalisoli]